MTLCMRALLLGIGGFIVLGVWSYFASNYNFAERCSDKWIAANITGLPSTLRRRVFGQHLATEVVSKVLSGHLNNKSPNKALAISFNGDTGTGKNFVSKIIVEHIFEKGLESDYVHLIKATHEFPHKSEVDFYKRQLRNLVVGSVSKCPRSLFIFDEVDKMPSGLIDVLKPYLDHNPPDAGKIDYRQSIFIFLSNEKADVINEVVLKHWYDGKEREDIEITEIEEVINRANNTGEFWLSSPVKKKLIDFTIPFLPLERKHVKQCAKADLEQKGRSVTGSILDEVADQLSDTPKSQKVFSSSGCKKVSSKVDFVVG